MGSATFRRLASSFLAAMMVTLLIFSTRDASVRGSGGALILTAPYAIGATYLSGQPGVALANSAMGTGYVKATATGGSSSTVYKSTAVMVLATPAERFTGSNQAGGVEVKGVLQNLHLASGTDSSSSVFVLMYVLDLYSDLTISGLTSQTLYLNSTPHFTSTLTLDKTASINWVTGHIYRAAVFVVAEAFAGGPGHSAQAYTNFTLNAFTWTAPQDFPSVQVSVPASVGVPPVASPGDTVTVYGSGFHSNENVKVKLIALDSNYRPIQGGTKQIVVQPFHTSSNGSIQVSFKVPSNATPVPGNYAVRIVNATGEDALDAAITLTVPIFAPTLPPINAVPVLLLLAAIPIITRRMRPRIH